MFIHRISGGALEDLEPKLQVAVERIIRG